MYSGSYLSVSEFLKIGEGAVRIGTAPDGLPLLTQVAPPPQAEGVLFSVAITLGMEAVPPTFVGTPLEGMANELRRLLRANSHCEITAPNGETDTAFILPRPVGELLGATLMERLFHRSDGTRLDTRVFPSVSAPEGAGSPTVYPPPAPNFRPGIAYLGLRVSDAQPIILRRESAPAEWPRFVYRRAYEEETLHALDGGILNADVFGWSGSRSQRLSLDDTRTYVQSRITEPGIVWFWTVPRNAVARGILRLAEYLSERHARDEVHGDLKPANILLTARGPVAIDSLELKSGQQSPGMTRGWAAPEQILGRPVSPETDQYPLGLLLLELVGGVVFGEEVQVTIPTGGRQVERHTLLRNPGVFIDPATAPIQGAWVRVWQELIERTLRYEAGERFEGMRSLCAALRPLLEEETLNGEIVVPLGFGELALTQEGGEEPQPAWVV